MRKLICLVLVAMLFVSVLSVSAFAQAPGYTGTRTTVSYTYYRCQACHHIIKVTNTTVDNYRSGTWLGGNTTSTAPVCTWCGAHLWLADAGFAELHPINSVDVDKNGVVTWWP